MLFVTRLTRLTSFVLNLNLEVALLDVGDPKLGSHIRAPEVCRARADLGLLSVVRMVVAQDSVSEHAHNPWKRVAVARIRVCVQEDAEAVELVWRKCVLNMQCSQSTSKVEHAPMLPKTGPGCALSSVSHTAIPSPYKWLESPVI